MQSIGANATRKIAGLAKPTPAVAVTKPSVAASEYPGAVDATPMTTFETNEIAPVLRPFSAPEGVAAAGRSSASAAPSTCEASLRVGVAQSEMRGPRPAMSTTHEPTAAACPKRTNPATLVRRFCALHAGEDPASVDRPEQVNHESEPFR